MSQSEPDNTESGHEISTYSHHEPVEQPDFFLERSVGKFTCETRNFSPPFPTIVIRVLNLCCTLTLSDSSAMEESSSELVNSGNETEIENSETNMQLTISSKRSNPPRISASRISCKEGYFFLYLFLLLCLL